MKKTIIILIFLCISIKAFNQYSYYKEVVLIKNNGLKIHGFVEKSSESSLNPKINFKENIDNKDIEVINVSEIKQILFLSDSSLYQTIKYNYKKDTLKISEYRLAKKLVDGYAQLFKLQLPDDELNIIFEKNNTYVYILFIEGNYYVLDQVEEIREIKDNTYNSNNLSYSKPTYILKKNYQGLLNYLLREHADLQEKVWNLKFSDNQIALLINDLNKKYPDINRSLLLKKEKIVIIHGPEVGLSLINSNKNSVGTGLNLGYKIGFIYPHLSEKYITNIGVYCNIYQTYIDQKKYLYIRIPVSGIYSFNNKKISPYIGGGVSFYFYDILTTEQFTGETILYYTNRISSVFLINGILGVKLFNKLNIHIDKDFSPNLKLVPQNYLHLNLGYLF